MSWMKLLLKNKDVDITESFGSQSNFVDSSLQPVWVPDNQTKICMLCASTFTVVKRRHHCRNCGKIFCANCTSKKKKKVGRIGKRS